MVFYSSAPLSELLAELAGHQVAGVFVANRQTIGEALIGLADTVIGKAVDLSHMRGIAMAEVMSHALRSIVGGQLYESGPSSLEKFELPL